MTANKAAMDTVLYPAELQASYPQWQVSIGAPNILDSSHPAMIVSLLAAPQALITITINSNICSEYNELCKQ